MEWTPDKVKKIMQKLNKIIETNYEWIMKNIAQTSSVY